MMYFPFFHNISTMLLQIVPKIARIPGGTELWGVQKCANNGTGLLCANSQSAISVTTRLHTLQQD